MLGRQEIKKEYTAQSIREELQNSTVFTSVKEEPDEFKQKKKLEQERYNYIRDMMGGFKEENAQILEKTDQQESIKKEKSGKKSIKKTPGGKLKSAIPTTSGFVQKLPKAKEDKKFYQIWKHTENDEVDKLRKLNKNADLCTYREGKALQEYINNGGYKEAGFTQLNDDAKKNKYLEMVETALSTKIELGTFTDAYLSEHIVELLEFTKVLEELDDVRSTNPELFESLPYKKRMRLAQRCEIHSEMRALLMDHLKLHKLHYEEPKGEQNGKIKILDYDKKTTDSKMMKERAETNFAARREKFLYQLKYGKVINQANAITKISKDSEGNGFSSESVLKNLKELISSKPEAYKAYGEEILLAYSEIQRVLSVRDGAIEEMRQKLGEVKELKGNSAQNKQKEIKVLMDRCELTETHVGHYRDTIRFIMGDINDLPKETMSFIKEKKMDALTDIVDLRIMGDCLSEAKALNGRVQDGIVDKENNFKRKSKILSTYQDVTEDRKTFKTRFRDAKKEDSDFKVNTELSQIYTYDNALTQIDKLSGQVNDLQTEIAAIEAKHPIKRMTNEEFFALAGKYHEIRKPINDIRKLRKEAESDQLEKKWDAVSFGKQNKMTANETKLSQAVLDPIHNSKTIDWVSFNRAVSLTPNRESDKSAVKTLRDGGLMPVVNMICSLDDKTIDNMSVTKNLKVRQQKAWDNYSLLRVGCNILDFKETLRFYNIELTNEQEAKLNAFGKVAPKMVKGYDVMFSVNRSPMEALYIQKDVQDNFGSLLKNVLDVDQKHEDEANDVPTFKGKYNKLGSRDGKGYTEALTENMKYQKELNAEWTKAQKESYSDEYRKEFELKYDPELNKKEEKKEEDEKKDDQEKEDNKIETEKEKEEREKREKEEQEKREKEEREKKEKEEKEKKEKEEKEKKEREKKEKEEKEKKERKKKDENEIKKLKQDKEKEDKKKDKKLIVIDENSEEAQTAKREEEEDKKKEYKVEDYSEETFKDYVNKLRAKGIKVPLNKDRLAILRSQYKEKKRWYYADEEDNIAFHESYFWKKDVDPLIIEAYDWMMGFFRSRDKGNLRKGKITEQEMPNLKCKIEGPKDIYERQPGGSNNCWCCSAAALYNQFAGKKLINQYTIRNFSPTYKSQKEVLDAGLDKTEYNQHLMMTKNYAGKGKTRVGNIFEDGDALLTLNKDMMINRMVFNTPALEEGNKTREEIDNEDIIFHNQKVAFAKTVHKALESGNLVSLLTTYGESGHYVTITGIDGETLTILDSLPSRPLESTCTIDDVLTRKQKGSSVEITYLSKMKKPEELTNEFTNLKYDSKKKSFGVEEVQTESAINVAQTKGICVSKYPYEMDDGMENISYSVYIPKTVK